MKKTIISFVLGLLICGSAYADNVSLATAKQAGATFFSAATGAKAPVDADQLTLAQQIDNPVLCVPALYCFNVADNGFVVVSGCDGVEPVLAYSPDGRIDADLINPAAQSFLNDYAQLVTRAQNASAGATAAIRSQWDELLNASFRCDITKAGVLVQSKWGQGDPDNPDYNICCPTISGKHCIAGCGPVAMAMIVHYWKYPVKGKGTAALPWNSQTISYNFAKDSNKFLYDSMPNKLKSSSTYGQKHAISKLMFACGVVMRADWGLDGTGVTREYLESGMERYFKYDEEMQFIQRDSYSDAQWVAMLHEELDDNSRPIYYAAYSPGSTGRDAGHAFVICGTSAADQNKFYINWGWDGSSNGFYTLAPASSIEAAGGYTFSNSHGMVIKMHPIETTGIEEFTQFAETRVYPNPASEYVMIPAYDLNNNALLTVYSIDGKMIGKAIIPAHSNEYRLDLQGYAAGTYFYRLNGNAVKFTVR